MHPKNWQIDKIRFYVAVVFFYWWQEEIECYPRAGLLFLSVHPSKDTYVVEPDVFSAESLFQFKCIFYH